MFLQLRCTGTGHQGMVTDWVLDLGVVPTSSRAGHMTLVNLQASFSASENIFNLHWLCTQAHAGASEGEIKYPQLLLPVGAQAGRY